MQRLSCLVIVTIQLWAGAAAAQPKLYFDAEGLSVVVTDGKRTVKPRLGTYDLRELVRDNPRALSYAEEHLATSHRIWLIYGVGEALALVAILGGITLSVEGDARIGLGLLVVAVPISLVTAGSSLYLSARAQRSLFRAVNTYNGVVYPPGD